MKEKHLERLDPRGAAEIDKRRGIYSRRILQSEEEHQCKAWDAASRSGLQRTRAPDPWPSLVDTN